MVIVHVPVKDMASWHRKGHNENGGPGIGFTGCALSVARHEMAAYALGRVRFYS